MTVSIKAANWLKATPILACLLPAVAAAADRTAAIEDAVEAAFQPLLKQYDVPGLAVAVTVDGQRYFFNYGTASRKDGKPITQDTLFEIGSVSKTFTATLASYAEAVGKLSLDDRPGEYIPQLGDNPINQASLLNLITYTAGGLPLQFPSGVDRSADMVRYFSQWSADVPPGTRRQYSNPSIGLAGHLTGLAMKGHFPTLIETEIFSRLGLSHSYIHVPDAAMSRYAWGYNRQNKPTRVSPGLFDAEAYGVKSTSADMIRFIEANMDPEALEPPMRQAVEGTHIGYFRVGEMVQGLGWEQYPFPITLERLLAGSSTDMIMKANQAQPLSPPQQAPEGTLFNKTGSTNGFAAYAIFVPSEKVGLVMLANKNFPIPARITAAHAVLEAITVPDGAAAPRN